MPQAETYRLNPDGSITCLVCGMTSWHPEDVGQRYCGGCHMFHSLMGHLAQRPDSLDMLRDATTRAGLLRLIRLSRSPGGAGGAG